MISLLLAAACLSFLSWTSGWRWLSGFMAALALVVSLQVLGQLFPVLP